MKLLLISLIILQIIAGTAENLESSVKEKSQETRSVRQENPQMNEVDLNAKIQMMQRQIYTFTYIRQNLETYMIAQQQLIPEDVQPMLQKIQESINNHDKRNQRSVIQEAYKTLTEKIEGIVRQPPIYPLGLQQQLAIAIVLQQNLDTILEETVLENSSLHRNTDVEMSSLEEISNISIDQNNPVLCSNSTTQSFSANNTGSGPKFFPSLQEWFKSWCTKMLKDENRDKIREIKKRELYRVVDGDQENSLERVDFYLNSKIAKKQPQKTNIWLAVLYIAGQGNAYRDLFIINRHIDRFNDTLREFAGYYDGFLDDLLLYMKEYAPTIRSIDEERKIPNVSQHKYTLSDIYITPSLDTATIKKCLDKVKGKVIVQNCSMKVLDVIPDTLSLSMRSVANIPEVCRDLSIMPRDVFDRILNSVSESTDKLTETEYLLLEYVYTLLRFGENGLNNVNECFILRRRAWDALKDNPNREGQEINLKAEEELYKEGYKAMVLFYRYAPYSYVDPEAPNKEERVMGKDVIIDQEYIKCEAIVEKYSHRLVDTPNYSSVMNHWDSLNRAYKHSHVQFVDNSLQTITRVCLPTIKDAASKPFLCIHTVSDIISYLKKIYNINQINSIYALKTQFATAKWTLVSEEDKNKTIIELYDENCGVVFYYIKEGLKDNQFTLSIFEKENSVDSRKVKIPLFLSRFMKTAMQLEPYTKQGEHSLLQIEDLQNNYVLPSVYNYFGNKISTGVGPERGSYTQIEKYFSEFYLDTEIFDFKEHCPTICCSSSEIENGNDQGCLKVIWYARVPKNREEYTHYAFCAEETEKDKKEERATLDLFNRLNERSERTNSFLYGFYLSDTILHLYKFFMCKKLEEATGYKSDSTTINPYTHKRVKIVVFKNIDHTKGGLLMHNDLLRLFLSKRIE